MKKKLILFFSSLVLVLCLIPAIKAAALTYYETSSSEVVPIWSNCYSSSNLIAEVPAKGYVLKVDATVTNDYGNKWYKLASGNYNGKSLTGCYVYSGNVKSHTHDYTGGICQSKGCGYEYPLTITTFNATFVVTNSDGCTSWNRPYSNNATKGTVYSKNTVLSVTAKTTNQAGNLWYRLSNGYWIYSGNVKQRYTVTYNANGGSPTPATQYKINGTALKLTSTVPTKKGYVFKCWNTKSDGSGTSYSSGASYTANANVTLYAKWATCSHDYTGGICSICGYEYPLTITTFNATFVVTNSDGCTSWNRPYSYNATKGTLYSKNTVLSVTAKTTNQAGNLWYRLSNGYWIYSGNVTQRYTVTYNANGGSPTPSSQYKLKGTNITLSSTKPSRVGYNFKCWNTKSDGSGDSYNPGTIYSANANLTLYAIWKTCSHDYEGGICIKCKYEYPLTITSFSAAFVVTNADGAPAWNRPYSYNATKVTTYSKNTALNVNAKTTNAAGNLWYRLTDGNWVYSGNLTQRFYVAYNANNGKNPPATQYKLKGSSITLSSTKPTRVGYNFKCWNTKSDGTGTSYNPGATYSGNASVTLYAIWNTCSHTYSGGICSKCKYEYPLTITSFSATFRVTNSDGAKIWNRAYSVNSTNVRVAAKNSILTVNAKTTNAAGNVWYRLTDGNWVYSGNVARCYKVSYVLNGGTNNSSNPTYYTASDEITLKSASRTGYSFAGWYKESVFTNKVTKISKGSTGAITLYAKWTANTYKIAFNGNGATSGSMSVKNATYGNSVTLPSNSFSKTGYTFNGWNTKADGSGTSYANGASVSNLTSANGATVTLYAQWKAIPKPSITTPPSSVTAAVGSTVTFNVAASGTGLSYQWQYSTDNGKTWHDSGMTGYNTSSIQVDVIAGRNGYLYKCIVKNSVGSVTSSAAKLTVSGVKPRIVSQTNALTTAPDLTVTFKVVAAGTNLSYTWQYSTDGGNTWHDSGMTGYNTSALKVQAISGRNGYLYRCIVSNNYGSVISSPAKLTVK